jgi:hypothetical protein
MCTIEMWRMETRIDVHVPVLVVVEAVDVIGVGRHDLMQCLVQGLGRTRRGHLHRPRTQSMAARFSNGADFAAGTGKRQVEDAALRFTISKLRLVTR